MMLHQHNLPARLSENQKANNIDKHSDDKSGTLDFQCHAAGRRRGSGANCAVPERRSSDLRRPPRHFIAKQEKRPGKPAYFRTKMNSDPVHPAEIVLIRINRYLTRNNPLAIKTPESAKPHPPAATSA